MTGPPSPVQLLAAMPFASLVRIEITEARPDLVSGPLECAPECCTAGKLMHGGSPGPVLDACTDYAPEHGLPGHLMG
jgi:hypothetical protein